MFGYNYHFTTDPDKGTIKLKPTAGTYAKAFAPTLVPFIALLVMGAVANYREKRQTAVDNTPDED